MDKILTVNDVAELLHVKPITVREMFRERRLRAFKVGKSWRTTEKMLQEDIEALARGEAPATLPMPNGKTGTTANHTPPGKTESVKKQATRKKSSNTKESGYQEDKASYLPAAEEELNALAEDPFEVDVVGNENDDEEDDLQQYLF